MDKLRLRLGVSGVLSAMALVFLTAAVTVPATEAAAAPAAAMTAVETGVSGDRYLLRACGDYVGVFDLSQGKETLVTVTEIPLAGLRLQDRSALESGIAVNTREELLLLLEDFGS